MLTLKTYEQTGIFDPTNPTQRKREVYTGIPGGYGSFYWNVMPNEAQLKGLRGPGFWASIPAWGQALIVGGIAVGGGYFGWKHLGPPIKAKIARLRR